MTLLKGALLSFTDPILGFVPTTIVFQYNPTEVTRVLRTEGPDPSSATNSESKTGNALSAPRGSTEEYTMTLEFDATDGLEHTAPITMSLGISPRLAALELLMQPVGSSALGGLASALFGIGHATIPVARVPLVFLAWGPSRITPVRLTSLTIHETGFDELLHPIHASADIGLTVLRTEDLGADDKLARKAADYYKDAREVKATFALPQVIELGG